MFSIVLARASLKPSLTPQYSSNPLPMTCICLSVGISPSYPYSLSRARLMMTPFISLILCSSPIAVNTSLPADQISAFSLFLSFSLSVYKSIGAFRPHSCFPVTIQIKLDQSFRLNLFLSYLQRIAFLGELLGQRSRHESLRRPSIEPVRRHIVLNTFGSLESRDFRTRKNPSINRFSLAVSSLPHIPY